MLIHVDALTDEGDIVKFKSRRYEVLNINDVTYVMNNMADDIDKQFESSQLSKSTIVIDTISKLTIHYDKYNPTIAGSYIELPKWISVFFSVSFFKNMCRYKHKQ